VSQKVDEDRGAGSRANILADECCEEQTTQRHEPKNIKCDLVYKVSLKYNTFNRKTN